MKRAIELRMTVFAVISLFGFMTSLGAQGLKPGKPIDVSESVQPAPVHIPSTPGTLIVPESSVPKTPAAGKKSTAHTNVELYIPAGLKPEEAPPFPPGIYTAETPASLSCVYTLVSVVAGCDPYSTSAVPAGGSNTIAIVDAYDDPSGPSDLAWFSLQFGLPLTLSQIQVIPAVTADSTCYYYGGVPVDPTGGWELEESLDVQWSHAMAPKANIYLVEACSSYLSDLQQAVLVANNIVQCGLTEIDPTTGALGTCPAKSTGKGEVSMSWGADVGEYPTETASTCTWNPADTGGGLADGCFTTPNVVYFASTGDSPGVIYPSTSPNVVAAGGLTTRRNASTFKLIASTTWVDGGGGISAYEKQPTFQSSGTNASLVQAVCGKTWRCVPDLSFDADPFTGVYVYDTFPYDDYVYTWWIVGGTSASAPSLAGIINSAGSFAASSKAELTTIYGNMKVAGDFTPITSAYCGPYMGYNAGTSSNPYNLCTGVGAVKSYTGK